MPPYRYSNLIDSLGKQNEQESFAQPVKKNERTVFYFLTFVFFVILFSFFNTVSAPQEMAVALNKLPLIKEIKQLVNWASFGLAGVDPDRLNILLMGVGGDDHQGPYLSDSMVLVSYQSSTGKVALISIPRDLYVPVPGFGWRKINMANALGMADNHGDGGKLAGETVSNIFDIPINYYLTIDFDFFRKVVDLLGGVTVNVEKSFADYQFPGPQYTYRAVSFKAGPQIMDGEEALQYARSRHGDNGEGNDFARARRQQKLILAIKDKVAGEIFKNPTKLWDLYSLFSDKISTNLNFQEILSFSKILNQISDQGTIHYVLDIGETGPLKEEVGADGAYLLRAKDETFKELSQIIKNIFDKKVSLRSNLPLSSAGTTASIPDKSTEKTIETIKITLLNGTLQNGLAQRKEAEIKGLGFQNVTTSNADHHQYLKNMTYFVGPIDQNILDILSEKIKIAASFEGVPQMIRSISPDADLYIILGTDN